MVVTKFFKGVSLSQIWRGDFRPLAENGMPEEQVNALRQVCENAPKSVYEFLVDADDPLFRNIYGDGLIDIDGRTIFSYPLVKMKKMPADMKPATGPIGTQTSKYHQEDILQHVALVALNLVNNGVSEELAKKLALLHDVGKKYTSATNKIGEICFYGHAEVSAFIVAQWLKKDESIDELTAKKIVAVTYGHMFAFLGYPEGFQTELAILLGDDDVAAETIDLIEKFSGCDEGVTEFTDEIMAKIATGQKLLLA